MSGFVITGTWDNVKLVCRHRHAEPVEMVIQEGPSSPFYACPKYHSENRGEDERACNNRLSLQDYTAMLEHIHKKIIEAELADEIPNLTNYSWKDRKGTTYTVLEQNGDKYVIEVYNRRAING